MDREQLMKALRAAHNAGDTSGAGRIAQMIQAIGAPSTPQPAAPSTQDPMLPSNDADTRSSEEYRRDEGLPVAPPSMGERVGGLLSDLGQSTALGLSVGTEGIANLPSQVEQAINKNIVSPLATRIFTPERVGRFAVTPEIAEYMEAEGGAFPQADIGALTTAAGIGDVTEYEPQTMAGDFVKTGSEFAVGGLLAKAPWLMGTLLPAVGSETAGQLTEGTAAEPWARFGGAVVAPFAATRLQRAVSPNAGSLDPQRVEAAQTLREAGITPSAGQVAGPVTGQNQLYREAATDAGRAIVRQADDDFTANVMRSVGSDARAATPEALEQANQQIGNVFNTALDGVSVVPNATNSFALQQALDEAADLTASGLPPYFTRISDAISKAAARGGDPIRNDVAMTWRSNLSELRKDTDRGVRQAANAALRVVDDIIENSVNATGDPAKIEALQTARRQYTNFLAIEKAARRAEFGSFTPAQLRTALLSVIGDRAYTQGRGDLSRVTQAATNLLTKLPNSGTSQRGLASQIATNSATGTGAGLGAFAYGLDPTTAATLGIGATVAPAIRNQVMSSDIGQRYFLNQLMPQTNMTPRMAGGLLSSQAPEENNR